MRARVVVFELRLHHLKGPKAFYECWSSSKTAIPKSHNFYFDACRQRQRHMVDDELGSTTTQRYESCVQFNVSLGDSCSGDCWPWSVIPRMPVLKLRGGAGSFGPSRTYRQDDRLSWRKTQSLLRLTECRTVRMTCCRLPSLLRSRRARFRHRGTRRKMTQCA